MKLDWNFQKGGGGGVGRKEKSPFRGGGMDNFWNHTLPSHCMSSFWN